MVVEPVHPRGVVDQFGEPTHRFAVHARLAELNGGLHTNLQGVRMICAELRRAVVEQLSEHPAGSLRLVDLLGEASQHSADRRRRPVTADTNALPPNAAIPTPSSGLVLATGNPQAPDVTGAKNHQTDQSDQQARTPGIRISRTRRCRLIDAQIHLGASARR